MLHINLFAEGNNTMCNVCSTLWLLLFIDDDNDGSIGSGSICAIVSSFALNAHSLRRELLFIHSLRFPMLFFLFFLLSAVDDYACKHFFFLVPWTLDEYLNTAMRIFIDTGSNCVQRPKNVIHNTSSNTFGAWCVCEFWTMMDFHKRTNCAGCAMRTDMSVIRNNILPIFIVPDSMRQHSVRCISILYDVRHSIHSIFCSMIHASHISFLFFLSQYFVLVNTWLSWSSGSSMVHCNKCLTKKKWLRNENPTKIVDFDLTVIAYVIMTYLVFHFRLGRCSQFPSGRERKREEKAKRFTIDFLIAFVWNLRYMISIRSKKNTSENYFRVFFNDATIYWHSRHTHFVITLALVWRWFVCVLQATNNNNHSLRVVRTEINSFILFCLFKFFHFNKMRRRAIEQTDEPRDPMKQKKEKQKNEKKENSSRVYAHVWLFAFRLFHNYYYFIFYDSQDAIRRPFNF